MAQTKPINLIQAKLRLSPQMELAAELLHTISIWALGILIISGVIASGFFLYLRAREGRMAQTKTQLTAAIGEHGRKEGILFTLKQRVVLVDKLFSGSALASVSLDDHSKVVLSVHAQSVGEVVGIVSAVVKSAAANAIRVPQLVSFSMKPTGIVDLTMSFVAVL